MSDMIRAHLIIKGVVQGVFFRSNMEKVARSNNVTGRVKNLPDGETVEVALEGERGSVEKVICWSLRGPPLAKVREVHVIFEPYTGVFKSFTIKY